VTAEKLRQWRGVKPVAAPGGITLTTRLRLSGQDAQVLNTVAEHLGRLRRADLAAHSRREPVDAALDAKTRRQQQRASTNSRKKVLTAQTSSRWASTVFSDVDQQVALARRGQIAHRNSLRQAIVALTARISAPVGGKRAGHRGGRSVKGYASQAQRYVKQQRLQVLTARLAAVETDLDDRRVRVVEGGKRLLNVRHNLDAAGLGETQWRDKWDAARWRISANGSSDEPFGNLTITVDPTGTVSLRLPKPLEYLANAPRGRYQLDAAAVFTHQGDLWRERVTGGKAVSYTFTREHDRGGAYLRASWATSRGGSRWTPTTPAGMDETLESETVTADGEVLGVDLNDGHLAVRHLDRHGNPVGAATTIPVDLSGSSSRRDAQVRHAISTLLRLADLLGVTAIAVEDLDFADARAAGRETMGVGRRGKRFRRAVSGIPTAVFRNRITSMCHRAGISLYAVNPAYTSKWGSQHWQHPYRNVNRHQAAATVIGRRAQGFRGRRRSGVTDGDQRITVRELPTRPTTTLLGEFRVAGPRHPNAGARRHNKERPRRATVTPAFGHPDRLTV
jgi:IS605 OrfB family transposase